MLTIFSTTRAFKAHFKIIQTNAIKSWLALHPDVEVILFGNEDGVAEISAELGLKHIPEIECNEYGTTLTNRMFDITQKVSENQYVGFVSADIILMGDFLTALRSIPQRRFLMVGRRTDLEVNELVDYSDPEWESVLRRSLSSHGKLHPPTAIDYFIFNRGLYGDMPPFAMGRSAVDNWLIYQARFLKAPVIDASRVVTAIHQNHGYLHHHQVIATAGVREEPEKKRNIELMGGPGRGFTIEHATRILTPQGMKRAMTPRQLYFRLAAIPVIHPGLYFLRRPVQALTDAIIAARKVLGITKSS